MAKSAPEPAKRQRRPWGSAYQIPKAVGLWYCAFKAIDSDTGLTRRFVNVPAMLPDGRRAQTKEEAEQVLRDRRHQLEHHEDARPMSADRFTLGDALKAVTTHYEVNALKSLGMVLVLIRHVKRHFGDQRLLRSLNALAIREYQSRRRQHIIVKRRARTIVLRDAEGKETGRTEIPAVTCPTSARQVNMETGVLRHAFRLALEAKMVTSVPAIHMLKGETVRKGFVEADQFAAILKHLPERAQGVARFAYLTGWRVPSECIPLEWRQVDFASGTVTLDDSKNGEPRTFPLTRELRALLEERRTVTDRVQRAQNKVISLVFHDDEGDGISRFDRLWKAAATAAGRPATIPHDLRRTAVRNLSRAGVPDLVAMKLTGHKTRSVYDRYNIASESDLRVAQRLLDEAPTSKAASFR